MKKTAPAPLLFVSSVTLLVAPAFAQQPDPLELAGRITERRNQNQIAMRDYAWTSRTEIKVKNEIKMLKAEMIRYTVDGEIQRTTLSESEPDVPKFGVRGKVAKKKVKGMKEWAVDLKALLQQYSLPTSGNLLDFLEKATFKPGEEPGIMQISANAVVKQGDQMDWWIDTEVGGLQRTRVITDLDGDRVEVSTLHRKLESGLSYVAQQTVQVPGKNLEMVVENFNFDRQ